MRYNITHPKFQAACIAALTFILFHFAPTHVLFRFIGQAPISPLLLCFCLNLFSLYTYGSCRLFILIYKDQSIYTRSLFLCHIPTDLTLCIINLLCIDTQSCAPGFSNTLSTLSLRGYRIQWPRAHPSR